MFDFAKLPYNFRVFLRALAFDVDALLLLLLFFRAGEREREPALDLDRDFLLLTEEPAREGGDEEPAAAEAATAPPAVEEEEEEDVDGPTAAEGEQSASTE